jgi:uncharacterized protein (DUF1800 family)
VNRIAATAAVLTLALACAGAARADLAKVRAEARPVQRARLALDNANAQLDSAAKSYKTGGLAAARAALDEVLASVELAKQSLDQTGRNPRTSSDYKNLEIKTRALLKKLGALVANMSFEEREELKPMLETLQKIHDDTLMAIMEGQKKKEKK